MGDDAKVCILRGCATGSSLGSGAGVLVVVGGTRFYSDSVVTLGAMLRFTREAEL